MTLLVLYTSLAYASCNMLELELVAYPVFCRSSFMHILSAE